jgi:hypothetical protein
MIKDFTKSLLTNLISKETKEEVISIKIQLMKRKIFCKIIIIKQELKIKKMN